MIKNATYVSVWDGFDVETSCKVNMETHEIFDIEVSDFDADHLETLTEEYVLIDGKDYDVVTEMRTNESHPNGWLSSFVRYSGS